jgi:hypothetical protein
MTNEPMDTTFRELQAELAVTPSPEFAAKVRARVAEQPARGWFGGWRVVAASVAVVAGAVVAVVMWRGGAAASHVAAPPAVTKLAASPPAAVEPPALPMVAATRQPRLARPAAVAVRTALRPEPEVLVPPDERIALTRLLVALKEGRAFVPAAESLFDEQTGELKPLAAIAPLVVEPLTTAADGGGSGRREQ